MGSNYEGFGGVWGLGFQKSGSRFDNQLSIGSILVSFQIWKLLQRIQAQGILFEVLFVFASPFVVFVFFCKDHIRRVWGCSIPEPTKDYQEILFAILQGSTL